jgi:hypothetical protein
MNTTTEYRAMAEECIQWAREATTHNTRSAYLEIRKDMACSGGRAPRWGNANTTPSH